MPMGWLNKLFGKTATGATPELSQEDKRQQTDDRYAYLSGLDPKIRIGRYSDNHKSRQQLRSWQLAETKFGEKQYADALFAFFDFLSDSQEQNITCHPEENGFRFSLIQGSKKITGSYDGQYITAYTSLAVMPEPGTAVMRRLLELNYALYYSHSAINKDNRLKMIFCAPITAADPPRLYFGLRELATKADQIDDLMLSDFPDLEADGTDHLEDLPEKELETKYKFFRTWTEETLNQVAALNPDTFSGAIAYLLLSLIYRIDFLLTPEGKLLAAIEKIHTLYWAQKEEVALVDRNRKIRDAVYRLLDISKEDFKSGIIRTAYTFSVTPAPPPQKIAEYVAAAGNDARWYLENKYPSLVPVICEYSLLYSQFVYSLPRVQTELVTIFTAIQHPDYFMACGMSKPLYNTAIKELDKVAVIAAIDQVIARHTSLYRALVWNHDLVSYNSLHEFSMTFSAQLAGLDLEIKQDT